MSLPIGELLRLSRAAQGGRRDGRGLRRDPGAPLRLGDGHPDGGPRHDPGPATLWGDSQHRRPRCLGLLAAHL